MVAKQGQIEAKWGETVSGIVNILMIVTFLGMVNSLANRLNVFTGDNTGVAYKYV